MNEGVSSHTSDWVGGEGWLQTTFYYPKYSRGVNYSFRWVSFATHSFFLSYFFGRCKKNHFNYPSVNRGELRLNLGWMGIIAASRKIPAEEIVIILTFKGGNGKNFYKCKTSSRKVSSDFFSVRRDWIWAWHVSVVNKFRHVEWCQEKLIKI